MIVGGRQSAFETAALMAERVGASATVVCRDAAPEFAPSDWSWVEGHLQNAERNPGWFASLSEEERESITQRFWKEGRLKLEPWLGQRLSKLPGISVIDRTTVSEITLLANDRFRVRLSSTSEPLEVDEIILATGYRPDIGQVPYLANGNLLPYLECEEGQPRLDESFQCPTIRGLFLVGPFVSNQFGPYVGFVASCRFAARTIAQALSKQLGEG